MLISAVLMVLFSRILPYPVNGILNIVMALLHTLFVIASFFTGITPSMFYLFFAGVEILLTMIITILAIRWTKESVQDIDSYAAQARKA
ncbi:MAG: hypothetical protein JXA21_23935 [Anaerolineae bacterium]|nr:hypothetical protein [Anaerolineae bacterium]